MKHSLSTLMLFLLALFPIAVNMCRPLFIHQKYSLLDLYFPMYNQYSLFFPLVVILLSASIFYIEYSNDTYVDLITYGYSKKSIIEAKIVVASIILILISIMNYLVLISGLLIIVHGDYNGLMKASISFAIYSFLAILINVPLGAIFINIFRNAIVTTVLAIVCMVTDAIFMAAPFGYYIPFIFIYRLGLLPLSKSYFFSNTELAFRIGMSAVTITIVLFTLLSIWQFSFRKKIES